MDDTVLNVDLPVVETPKNGTILEKRDLTDTISWFRVYAPHIANHSHPGQFVIIRISSDGERVPLTIVDSSPDEGWIVLVVQGVGKSTKILNEMHVGEKIHDVFGPLGNPSTIKQYGKVAIVGGGLGAAVAFPVAKALKEAGNEITTIVGARSKDIIILQDEIEAISDHAYFTTDDGTYGRHGFVTEELKELLESGEHFDHVFAIGPLVMMRAIADLTRPYQIPTTVSLNTIMVDGTGMCGGCRVNVGSEMRFTCVDGPEFDGHLVDFDTVIKRNRAYNHPEDCQLDVAMDEAKLASLPVVEHPASGPRTQMPEQPPAVRIRNFNEVTLGFTPEMAKAEAARCLKCRVPKCVQGCPVSVKIPQFLHLILEDKVYEAGELIKTDNALPRVCGRVCPQSDQCEGACILLKKGAPIAIGALERYVSDFHAGHAPTDAISAPQPTGPKVALVGSGPASLACAGDLINAGCQVTVFEALHDFGGVLRYGIPEFRLPKAIVSNEVESLRKKGVIFEPNTLIGATVTIGELLKSEGFQAVFVGSGAGLPYFLNIPGESLVGIYSANEFLTRVNLMKAYKFPVVDTPILNLLGKTVAVIGGGNTALDSARVALRLGAKEVHIIYRRTEEEMPGRVEEIEHAKAEGVQFDYLRAPLSFSGNENGWVTSMQLQEMVLGEPDASGRRRPIPKSGAVHEIPVDAVIVAIGNGSNPIINKTTPEIMFDRWGHIQADPESMATSMAGVFAGGDIVTGGATVILAMGAGRKAAKSILTYLGMEQPA